MRRPRWRTSTARGSWTAGAGGVLVCLAAPVLTLAQSTDSDGDDSTGLALRPVLGYEGVFGEYGEVLGGHWRGEVTLYFYEFGDAPVRLGAGVGWISYGLEPPRDSIPTWNSARGHLALGIPVDLGEDKRFFVEPRLTYVRLRPEKEGERLAEPPDMECGCPDEPPPGPTAREATLEALITSGVGVEVAMGFEGPLPFDWWEGFYWSVSGHYGAFHTQRTELFGGVNSGSTWGVFLGAYWSP